MKTWTVYLLRCSDGTLYTGVTTNLERRVRIHNEGKGAKYTRGRRPVELIAFCRGLKRSAALRLEALLKGYPSNQKGARLLEEAGAGSPFDGDFE